MDHDRTAASSASEDLFIDIFQAVFGFERAQLLIPQYPFTDIYDGGRFIDFALLSRLGKYAFEIDGEVWHSPASPMVSPAHYRNQLLRQNSLVYQGWRVFRWTDTQLVHERLQVQQQLELFLEKEIAAGTLDGFLPLQEAGDISLRDHQSDALDHLKALRDQGKTIALITHATGTGKTHVAIADAKRLGLRTLYLAHRKAILSQTQDRLNDLWPEVDSCIYSQRNGKPHTHVVLSTVQAISANLDTFDEREFGYIIIDESHHAAADTYRQVVSYFRAQFILGLTATPERHDGQSLLEIFQTCAHRLSLEDAIERQLLVPIRCVRVKTNVDLNNIRYNGVDYRPRDLGERLLIPDRDRLIVDTYLAHAATKRAVCFCINVDHAEAVAHTFRQNGVSADHVSGRMAEPRRQQVLAAYRAGKIQVLCACDLLNEGWDSPETEVLLMARPTLSKVVYVQQLGRGTRKAAGKDCLLVFDFIDNTSRYAQAMSTHGLFKKPGYRPGALVAAPQAIMEAEENAWANGQKPPAILDLHLWTEKYEVVDIFRWQDEVKEMYQASELEIELGIGESVVRRWVEAGKLVPDHAISMGDRQYYYFKKDRLEPIRQQFKIEAITQDNIKDKLFKFVQQMDKRYSYKPVLLLGLLQLADDSGRVNVPELVQFFKQFYTQRLEQGQVVEQPTSRMAQVADLTDSDIERIMLSMPLEKFERRKFIRRQKELTQLKFNPILWRQLTPVDRETIQHIAQSAINHYYHQISSLSNS